MNETKTLVMFTESYPYGGPTEKGFVEPEIEALASQFDRVVIMPVTRRGEPSPLPPNVTVDNRLMKHPGVAQRLKGLVSPTIWRHILSDSSNISSLGQLRAAFAFGIYTLNCEKQIRSMRLNPASTLYYTFWLDYQATAVARLPHSRLVSRAHGYDVLPERSPFLSDSWRRETLDRITSVFVASEYLASRIAFDYPEALSRLEVRYLGSVGPSEPRSAMPETDCIRLLSVARVAPEKRVGLLLKLLKETAMAHPGLRFEWTHAGDGPQMPALRHEIAALPANLSVNLIGMTDNRQLHDMMHSGGYNALILTSGSEPLGIVLCEAMSHGIPVIATCVGGIPEVVDNSVGALLSAEPDADEFDRAMMRVVTDGHRLGQAARRRWEQKFNAAILRQEFAEELAVISE